MAAKKTTDDTAQDVQEPTEDQAEATTLQEPPETVQDAPTDSEETEDPKATTTKAQTFQEAADKATDQGPGYVGTSPERERTGMADKGLSLANPAILNGEGTVPDSRRGVDDSDALKG